MIRDGFPGSGGVAGSGQAGDRAMVPGAGGTMDLGFGVEQVWVAMTHTNRGEPKVVPRVTSPLTAPRCVRRIYTDMALIEVTQAGPVLQEVAPGVGVDEVRTCTSARLTVVGDCREMKVPESLNTLGI